MSKRASKSLIMASVLLPLLGAPALAFTFTLDKDSMAKVNHLIECATWLVNGDPRHAKFCTPSNFTKEEIDELTNFAGKLSATSPKTSSSEPCYLGAALAPSYSYSYPPDCRD